MRKKVGKMKSNAKSKIIILITVGIIFALLPIITNNISDDIAIDNEILKTSEVSGKISINGNSGWASFKAAGNCTGFGTYSLPYVIEDLEIDGGGSGSCILIENSDVYFEIENCTVYNSGGNSDAGISLSHVTNGELINNTVSFNQNHGINIKSCENITIEKNTINNSSMGIYVMDPPSGPPFVFGTSVNINIVENKIYNHTSFGIFLYRTNNSYVSKNNVSSCGFGIVSISSNDVDVVDNLVEDCSSGGIYGSACNNLNFTENLMSSCGISIYGEYSTLSTYSIDTSNKVNGKPVYFHLDSNNLDNADYINPGQIILVNCNSSNVSEINISDSSYALMLLHCNNVSVLDCNFSDNYGGIQLDYSNNNDISRNTIDNNSYVGIYLARSNNNSISLNNVSNNYDDLSPSLPYQGGPTVSRYEVGIGFWNDSNNNTIDGNTINNNKIGIYITRGVLNTVKGNYITENYEYGIFLETYLGNIATLNLIYSNTFNSNGINAQDNGTANTWDDGAIGNSWDDYGGVDANDDGIGDIPYDVPPTGGSMDNYPILEDGDDLSPNIIINSPSMNDAYGVNAPTFNITINDAFPINSSWYTIDGGITNYTLSGLTGTVNQTAWDNKGTESMILRFYANDSSGHIGFEDVTIWKDVDAPRITINSPVPYQLWGVDAPTFSLTIDEPNIQTKLYSINGRPNITFTSETQFSQSEWNTAGNGTVSITFYVIDKVGYTNSSGVIIRKDAYIPDVTITTPEQDGIFGNTPPEFIISIIEEDLESMWYTIEGDLTEYPFTGVTGTISQEAWDHAIEGDVTITFYAQDRAGNIGIESVVVTKSIPSTPSTDGIPGYNLFFLFGILSVVAIIISIKLKKFNK